MLCTYIQARTLLCHSATTLYHSYAESTMYSMQFYNWMDSTGQAGTGIYTRTHMQDEHNVHTFNEYDSCSSYRSMNDLLSKHAHD